MSHFNPKISIEVGVHYSHTTPSYGDGFIVSRSNRGALGMILILNVRSNISARACPSSPHRTNSPCRQDSPEHTREFGLNRREPGNLR
jgi:hypothetical protein